MSPSTTKQTAFRLDPEILDGLLVVKERDGMPLSEQVRRALRTWLADKGILLAKPDAPAAQRRRPTRRK
ncbi:MAG: hypothetical protein JW395_1820 [Nitrospira sp.]|nr:hypothetical protein [Nitrospira sp.]